MRENQANKEARQKIFGRDDLTRTAIGWTRSTSGQICTIFEAEGENVRRNLGINHAEARETASYLVYFSQNVHGLPEVLALGEAP